MVGLVKWRYIFSPGGLPCGVRTAEIVQSNLGPAEIVQPNLGPAEIVQSNLGPAEIVRSNLGLNYLCRKTFTQGA
jgi:hypothetical protein